ncbi:hypothetical protein H2202_004892 [Exophiala xenobiotica]|nr:hypothetical protein H2202_004892 [Exophiala xenobiotica]
MSPLAKGILMSLVSSFGSPSLGVNQTEIELGIGVRLGHSTQKVKALGDGPRFAFMFILADGLGRVRCLNDSGTVVHEAARLVNTEDGGEARSVDERFLAKALDRVLDSIEEELGAEEFKDFALDGLRDERLEI